MTSDFSYDPVTAVDEATANGTTAEVFSDIRETMGIPLVTSIWRGLAGMDDSLQAVWSATKPIYLSGQADRALERVIKQTPLPIPQAPPPTLLTCAGIDDAQLASIRSVLNAYNRSNGLNMVALAGLIAAHRTDPEEACPRSLPVWNTLPALQSREAIDANTWDLIRHVNALGTTGVDAHVATLWRHLGHWPGLLAILHTALTPLQVDGSISKAAHRMIELTQHEGTRLAGWRDETVALTEQARSTVTSYVTSPAQVARMVTIGHALAAWLPRA